MDSTTNTAGEALDLNKTRAEFEAWAEGYFMCFVLHKAGEGYASTMTQAAWEAWCAALARAGSAAPAGQQAEPVAPLSEKKIEAGWRDTFSTSNPFCPCDLKSFTKAVRWTERAAMSAAQAQPKDTTDTQTEKNNG